MFCAKRVLQIFFFLRLMIFFRKVRFSKIDVWGALLKSRLNHKLFWRWRQKRGVNMGKLAATNGNGCFEVVSLLFLDFGPVFAVLCCVCAVCCLCPFQHLPQDFYRRSRQSHSACLAARAVTAETAQAHLRARGASMGTPSHRHPGVTAPRPPWHQRLQTS